MADLIYNPLLKKGFQEVPDTGSIEAEIDDLRQHKITKCLTVAELDGVTDGEIFEWQGEDTITPATLKNGFFYKKTGTQQILPAGTQYFNNPSNTINLYNYNVTPGNFYLIEDLTPEASSIFFNYHIKVFEGNSRYKFVTLNNDYNVGDKAWDNQEQTVLTITSFTYDANFQKIINLSNGDSFLSTYSGMHIFNGLYKFVDDRLNEFFIVNCQEMYVWIFLHYTIDGNNFNILDWFAIDYEPLQITTTPTIIGNPTYTQTDTQPRVAGISNDEDGGVAISRDVTIAGNLTVQGTQTVVKTQEIDSENDNVNLRYNNPLPLADGEESGVKVLNYDGNNTNCFLGVDNQGWARVGDEGGTLQKLATIEETPTNGALVAYNTANKQLESTTIPAATTTAAGLMSAADKTKLNGIAAGAQVNPGAATQSAAGLMSAADKKKLDGIAAGAQVNPGAATTTTAGLMSAADKVKLNGIATGAQVNPSLSTTTQSGIQLAKYGRLCFLTGSLTYSTSITLPAAYKPSDWVYFVGVGSASSSVIFIAKGTINTNGVLAFSQPILTINGTTISFNPSNFPISFSVAYIAAS